ncbi:hypothetical protein JOC58_004763, partial [Paenibacillus hunanensis]|nr:hypothetical protein [Paenibacillus hunanensis]
WLCESFHSTRIRPWAVFYLIPVGVALHITIRQIKIVLYEELLDKEKR